MMRSTPPAYLKIIPTLFAVVVAIFLYGVYSFFAGLEGAVAPQGPVTQVIEDVQKAIEDAVSEIERVMALGGKVKKREQAFIRDKAERLARSKQKTSKPQAAKLAEKAERILDFSTAASKPRLILKTSPGVAASFAVEGFEVRQGGKSRASSSAKLSINDMGVGDSKKKFVTGVMELSVPVETKKMNALEIKVKAEGIKSFNVAIYVKQGKGMIGWSKTGLKVGEEFSNVTIPFADFDMWNYDIGKKGYTFPDKWAPPERIETLSFYLRPKNLADGKRGTLWIGAVALR